MIKEKRFKGIGVSEGYGIGKAVVIQELKLDYSGKSFTDAETESARLDAAVKNSPPKQRLLFPSFPPMPAKKMRKSCRGILQCLQILL